jgi:hypothetical protein
MVVPVRSSELTQNSAAEVLNSSRRAKGVALATCSNWFNNFIIVSEMPLL